MSRDEVWLDQLETPDRPWLLPESGGTAMLLPTVHGGRRYLFKRYRDAYRARLDAGALADLVAWRHGLGEDDRRVLDARAAWPRYTVRDRYREVVGLLTPLAHRTFLVAVSPSVCAPHLLETLRPGGRAAAAGGGRTPIEMKKRAFGRLVESVLWFHERGVVVNDVQPHNVLMSGAGDAVHLVDCDSMTGAHWSHVLPVVAPATFRELVPGQERPSTATDLAKLAWIIVQTVLEKEVEQVGDHDAELLAALVSPPVAELLLRACGMAGGSGADHGRWRELSLSWCAPTVRASAPVPRPAPPEPSCPPAGSWYPPWYPPRSAPDPASAWPPELGVDLTPYDSGLAQFDMTLPAEVPNPYLPAPDMPAPDPRHEAGAPAIRPMLLAVVGAVGILLAVLWMTLREGPS